MENININEVQEISKDLVAKMQEKHPDAGWTIWINLWMDDTFQVICRSGFWPKEEEDILITREFKWYDGEITYHEEKTKQIRGVS